MAGTATQNDQDYLLGVHDAEVERLGIQHRAWRPRMLDAWRRAGIGPGAKVIDAGAGPGWAALDLAEVVGSGGQVVALERSQHFLDRLTASAQARGAANLSTHRLDLAADPVPVSGADALWIRWVLAFLPDPQASLSRLAEALKPGGVVVIHEYLDYRTWAFAPPLASHEVFRDRVIEEWRASGGEPDIGRELPRLLPACGLRIRELRPLISITRPGEPMWDWPASFVRGYTERLVDEAKADAAWAAAVRADLDAAEADPSTVMVLPLVMEAIAEKL